MAPEEIEHYRWLLGGLLEGAEKLLAQAAPSAKRGATLSETLAEARELFAELMARITEMEETR